MENMNWKNNTIKELFERKSVRVFTDEKVSEEDRRLILEAALQAPTAGDLQLYHIIDVQSQEEKNILAERCDHQPFIAKAPLVLVFTADFQRWRTLFDAEGIKTDPVKEADLFLAMQDCIIAAQNAVAAAQSLGIGSCYIGDILENYEANRELLHLPKYAVPCVMLVMGHPTEQQKARRKPARLPLENVVSVDRYPEPDAERERDGLKRLMEKEAEEQEEALKAAGSETNEKADEETGREAKKDADADRSGRTEITDSAVCRRIRDTAERKFVTDFHREIQRSVKKILESWCE